MSKRILVTGATGTVGSELARLLVTAGGDIRAATRSPEKAERLFRSDVDVVELDYRRTSTFDAAVDGAEGIFLQAPPFDPDARETLVPLLDWAVQAGVGNVVMMTAMGVEVRDDLPIRRLEKHVESLGVAFTLLRPNFHMQHFAGGFLGERIRRTGAFSMPVGDARVSIVDGRDVAEVAAACLLSDEHDGKEFTLTGPEALTHQEIAETISGVIDAPVAYESVSDEEMLARLTSTGWRPEIAGVVIALYQSVRGGVRAPVTGDVAQVLGRAPVAFSDFAARNTDSWLSVVGQNP